MGGSGWGAAGRAVFAASWGAGAAAAPVLPASGGTINCKDMKLWGKMKLRQARLAEEGLPEQKKTKALKQPTG